MQLLATALINTSALWKIIVAALAGGAGVVIAFGILLLGLSRAKRARRSTQRLAHYAITGLAGAFCLAAVVIGIYAMAKKPATPKPKTKAAAISNRAVVRAAKPARARVVLREAESALGKHPGPAAGAPPRRGSATGSGADSDFRLCRPAIAIRIASAPAPAASANAARGPAVWLSVPAAATPIDAPVALALSRHANASVFVSGAAARPASA
jgi:hypothetical protein